MGAPETANVTSNPLRIDPRDPNYDEGPETAEREFLECCINEVRFQLAAAEALIAKYDFEGATKALEAIEGMLP